VALIEQQNIDEFPTRLKSFDILGYLEVRIRIIVIYVVKLYRYY
jgi:hypothetical protein